MNTKLVTELSKWIGVAITIGGLLVTVGIYKGKVDAHEARIKELEEDNKALFRQVIELSAKQKEE